MTRLLARRLPKLLSILRRRHAGWCAILYVECTSTKRVPFRSVTEVSLCTFALLPAATRMPLIRRNLRRTDNQNFDELNLGPVKSKVAQTNRVDERTDDNGQRRKAHNPDKPA